MPDCPAVTQAALPPWKDWLAQVGPQAAAQAATQAAATEPMQQRPVVVLTGAGISAESGVPTFRGPEGYWRVGSRNYRPMELATRSAFDQMPEEIGAGTCIAGRFVGPPLPTPLTGPWLPRSSRCKSGLSW